MLSMLGWLIFWYVTIVIGVVATLILFILLIAGWKGYIDALENDREPWSDRRETYAEQLRRAKKAGLRE